MMYIASIPAFIVVVTMMQSLKSGLMTYCEKRAWQEYHAEKRNVPHVAAVFLRRHGDVDIRQCVTP